MNENIQGLITSDLSLNDLDNREKEFESKINTDQTVEILHVLGFDWPEIDEDYLKRL